MPNGVPIIVSTISTVIMLKDIKNAVIIQKNNNNYSHYQNSIKLHPSSGTTEWQLVSYTVFEDWLIARGYQLTVDSS